jgi:outer membrane protein TolC
MRRTASRLQVSCVLLALAAAGPAACGEDAGSGALPIDLATTLRLAGAQNLDVQLARNAVEQAHAGYTSALGSFLPAIVPAARYLRHTGSVQTADGSMIDADKRSEEIGIALTGQVAVGEAVFGTLQGRRLVNAAQAGAQAQQQSVALLAAQQYFELVRAHALGVVLAQALAVSRNYQQQLGEAVSIGIAFKGDELRVTTQSERLQLDLTRAQQQQRIAAARLAQTLHLDPLVELAPAEAEPVPLALADVGATPTQLVSNALANRPELQQSQLLIDAAEQARRGALYGPLLPTLGMQLGAGHLEGRPDGVAASGGATRDRMVGLSWRIGPGGLFDLGRIRASNSRLFAAQLSELKVRDEVSRQVVESHTRVQSLFEQVRVARLNMTSATETLRLSRERKELGVGTVLEDIQAQQEVVRARSDYINAVTELNQEQYGLMRAVGTGLTQQP